MRTTTFHLLINKGAALVRPAGLSFLRGLHFLFGFGASFSPFPFFFPFSFFNEQIKFGFAGSETHPFHMFSASCVSFIVFCVPAGSNLGGAGAGQCFVLHPSALLYIPFPCFTSHSPVLQLIPLPYTPLPCLTPHCKQGSVSAPPTQVPSQRKPQSLPLSQEVMAFQNGLMQIKINLV